MAECDLCGRPATTMAIVEGARVNACKSCAQMGTELNAPQASRMSIRQSRGPAPIKELFVVPGAGNTLAKAREKKGMTAEQLGAKLSINADYIRKIEGGHIVPEVRIAQKLEKELGIKILVESADE